MPPRLGLLIPSGKLLDAGAAYGEYKKRGAKDTLPEPIDLQSFIRGGVHAQHVAKELLKQASKGRFQDAIYHVDEIQFMPPLSASSKVIATARNFRAHVEEMQGFSDKVNVPTRPAGFLKLVSCFVGHDHPVPYPKHTRMLDHEVEVAAVIGRQGRDISTRSAPNYIYGYTIMNDYTARDVAEEDKERGNFLYKGKNMDGLGALGPYVTTADEVGRIEELSLSLKVNGEVRQRGRLKDMIFSFPELISTFSSGITLYPGDIVSSGTPPGVAASRGDPSFFLKPGDKVEAEVTTLGLLRNTITNSR